MHYRYLALQDALAGYRQTSVPLVAFDGTAYVPAGSGDDLGIYFLIPRLAVLSGFSIARAIDVFFGAILAVCFLTGMLSFFFSIHRWPLRLWAFFSLGVLLYFSYIKGDVYIVQSATPIVIVPWFLLLCKKESFGVGFVAFLFGSGLVIGVANLIRSQAATGLGIFIVLLVAFGVQCTLKKKLAFLAVLLAGLLIPTTYFHGLRTRRDAFLLTAQPGSSRPADQHVFWHTLYAGLGFTKNQYVAGYDDAIVAEKVHTISPSAGYLSPEYERIVRTEVLRIVRKHPLFVFTTIAAKLFIIALLLLACGNIGLFAAALNPKPWAVELAFGGALAFNSLFGVIALPQVEYLLGFMTFATLYGIASLEIALARHQPGQLRERLRLLAPRRA